MKAWILQNNSEIVLADTELPELAENEVLVQVKAAGICGSDIPRIYNGGAYFYPLITGHEFSGKVVGTAKQDTEWLNKRVCIFPMIPCRKCTPCLNKQYEMCRSYSYLGSRKNGSFAEYVAVPKENLIELPDNVSYEEAAMMEPMAVAIHAIRRIKPDKRERIAICGLGTIGILILMFLLEMGAENIYAIGNKEFQKDTVLKLGLPADRYIDIKEDRSITADVYFECVGKNETVSRAINSTDPGGRIMLVGNPHSDMSFDKATYWKILRSQLTVLGTWNSSFTGEPDDDWHYVLDKLSTKAISPSDLISHRLGMQELEKGLLLMRDKTEDYIKVIMVN